MIAFDYAMALFIEAEDEQRARKRLLIASLAASVGLLAYFKDTNFALETLWLVGNAIAPLPAPPAFRILLPIGISFYTFEAISYAVDVYRRKIARRESLPRVPAVHPVLPAPRRRADRAGRRLPAADASGRSGLELGAGAWACSSS